jgi:hypothetical protein
MGWIRVSGPRIVVHTDFSKTGWGVFEAIKTYWIVLDVAEGCWTLS